MVPNGEDLGYKFGDPLPLPNRTVHLGHRVTAKVIDETPPAPSSHNWGIFFTILGTVLLDFDADACQSPARAYLLDVTVPGKCIFIIPKRTSFIKELLFFY